MPKETFFNLPEEKRTKILEAAKKEFTNNELYKSRVSNIIKDAEIPRGSFYQYFEDLDDLYYYLVEKDFDDLFQKGMEFAKLTTDVFEFSINTFDYDYDSYTNDKRHRFMMNVMRSLSSNPEYIERHIRRHDEYIFSILKNMDLSNIKFTEKKDLLRMYHMIQDVKRNLIRKSLIDKLTKEQAKSEFYWYINVLKTGLQKES